MNNKIQKNKIRILALIVILVILVSLPVALVSSLGISPASKTVYFKPNSTVEVEFDIINSEQNDFEAGLSVSGRLKDIIFFENQSVKVNAASFRTPFKTIIRFPEYIAPGIHTVDIKISPALTPRKDMFVAYLAPQIPIRIKVPYPFKYADVSLVILDVDEGTPVPIFVEFDNMGSEDIIRAGARVEIYDVKYQLLANLSTLEIGIVKNSVGKTQAQPGPILKRGLYRAVVKAYYDEDNRLIESNFTIGEPLIRIKKLATTKLIRDTINKVVFTASNEWNTELAATGYLEINKQKSELPSFKLGPREEKEITGFFDTTGLAPGEYTLSIALAYANQLKTEMFPVTIAEKAVTPEIIRLLPLLIILGIAIIGLLIFVILLVIKKRKKA